MPTPLRTLLVSLAALALLPAAANAAVPRWMGAQTHPFWGGATQAINVQELDKIAAAGGNSVRIDLAWSSLELNSKGAYDSGFIARVDKFMNDAAARNIKVVATFWTTPCWASSAPDTVKQGCAGSWWDRNVQLYPPSNPNDFADAAAWVAQRWGSKLAALEVWNEPNLDYSFRSTQPAADYAAILKAAYPKIKAAAPALPVLGPAMAFSDGAFLESLYANGIQGFFDGVSFHPYNEARSPYDNWKPEWKTYTFAPGIEWIHSILSAHGDGLKKLWLTEMGWSSCLPGGTDKVCVTEDQQAQYTADAMRIIRDRWDYVESALIYNLRNIGTTLTDRETSYGLLKRDFTVKPAYTAWKNVLAELAAGAPTPAVATDPPVAPPADTRPVAPPSVTPSAVALAAGSLPAGTTAQPKPRPRKATSRLTKAQRARRARAQRARRARAQRARAIARAQRR